MIGGETRMTLGSESGGFAEQDWTKEDLDGIGSAKTTGYDAGIPAN